MFKILVFILLSLKSFSYTNITPLVFDERIDGDGGYKEFILTNVTNNKLTYKIYVEKINKKLNMTNWVELYPSIISLKPGAKKKIKMLITSPENLKVGEYITNLCIKEIQTPNVETKEIQLYTNLKIELAGYIGDLKTEIFVDKLNVKNNKITFNLKNIGKKREKIEIYLKNKNESEIFIESVRLFISDTKEINIAIPNNLKQKKEFILIFRDKKGMKLLEKKINKDG